MVQAFTPIEEAIREVIEQWYPGKTGGDLSYERGDGLLIVISQVPGAGRTDETSGQWTIDLDVFGDEYLPTMDICLDIEAKLIGQAHRTTNMIIDKIVQTMAPASLPWEDSSVTRLGSGYVLTARRRG